MKEVMGNRGSYSPPDSELIGRCRRKDSRAWDLLVERYRRKVFNIAYQFVGNMQEAEDLTQELFLKIYQELSKFPEGVPFPSWLRKVSRNLCIDHYRKKRRQRGMLVQDLGAVLPFISQKGLNPFDQLKEKERALLLRRGMDALPPGVRDCVILREIQGCSYREIAEALNIPVGTVKSRINRGRAQLVRVLKSMSGLKRDN